MAKKKTAKPDRHAQPGFQLRLPAELREALAECKRRDRRTYVEIVRIALEEFLGKKGLWPPKGEQP